MRLTLCMMGNFECFFPSADCFQYHFCAKNSLRNTIRVSNNLDPYQSVHFAKSDLCLN